MRVGAFIIARRYTYWGPNVSGGLVVSKIPQRTEWNLDYNIEMARIAGDAGFDYALCADPLHRRLRRRVSALIYHVLDRAAGGHEAAAGDLRVLPGPWHPAMVAKLGATADQIFGGRSAVNVVSGWFAGEFDVLDCRGSSTMRAIGGRASSSRS